MRPAILTLFAASLLAAWAVAQPAADAPPSALEQSRLLKRNAALVTALVDGGLELSDRPDPLKRADRCRQLAVLLADEVRQAVRDSEESRAIELGGHLRSLVETGVGENLAEARRSIAVGSQQEKTLVELRDDTSKMLLPLIEPWQRFAGGRRPSPWIEVQQGLREAEARVDRAVQPPARLDRREPGK